MVWGRPLTGLIFVSAITLVVANFLDLQSISTIASAGLLLIFAMVNLSNILLAGETGSSKCLSALGLVMCMAALLAICVQVYLNPATRFQLWVLAAMLGLSFGSEVLYQVLKRRSGNR